MDRAALPVLLLLALAAMLGGGGTPAPLLELVLQLVASLLVAIWAVQMSRRGRAVSIPALIILAAFVAVPLLQLIPLPPALWHQLPGRAPEIDALQLIGRENDWRPLSMAPDRTLASLLASLPPLCLLVMVASMRRRERALVVATTAALGLLTLFVGMLQVRGGLLLFFESDSVVLSGFQANRNTTADVLLVSLIAGATALRLWNEGRPRHRGPLLIIAATAMFALLIGTGVVMTGSRTGVALLLVAIPAALLIAWSPSRGSVRGPLLAGLATIAVVLAGAGVALERSNTVAVTKVMSRFSEADTRRPELWRDTGYAIRQSFPFGTGVGTFVPVMLAAERLEFVNEKVPNRAHNEYLEFSLEAGILGLVVIAGLFLFVAVTAVREWSRHLPFSRAQISCACAALTIVALHSIVDYPFRSMSMASLIAAMVALLLPAPERKSE